MHEYGLILLLALGFALAILFGYIAQKLRLSPVIGYLLAGILLGPSVPGISLDLHLAHQLAEIGVILLMFGVGLHFHVKDLLAVKGVSLPGAVGQSITTTILGMLVAHLMGWSWGTGLILGMSVSVASTVILIRVLTDNGVLNTSQGHITVGWLIVEDIFTILVLVLLPAIAALMSHDANSSAGAFEIFTTLCIALGKISLLVFIVLFAGQKIIPWFLASIARTRSRELFTLSVLALAFLIASGSAFIFGASFALGAFLAGMAVGQTNVGEEAAADALPMRDAFAVIFFVSVGMLFNPFDLIDNLSLFLLLMGIVILLKPLVSMLIVVLLGHSTTTAFTVAIALAQIGEFTFILSNEAGKLGLMPPVGASMLVATAIFSIALNPLLFKAVPKLEAALLSRPKLWRLFNRRAVKKMRHVSNDIQEPDSKDTAVIIGYGPVGQTVSKMLSMAGVRTVIIDLNVDTIAMINKGDGRAVFGNASKADILKAAGIERAKYLVITPTDLKLDLSVINTAREMNSEVIIYSRARFIAEKNTLENFGIKVCYEELESAVALAEMILRNQGFSEEQILKEVENVRKELSK
ncbi:MAG: cation:proton antiporter [Leptospirales bacterium]|nr:cation:proton antiporter [Leptospirales bacterium]